MIDISQVIYVQSSTYHEITGDTHLIYIGQAYACSYPQQHCGLIVALQCQSVYSLASSRQRRATGRTYVPPAVLISAERTLPSEPLNGFTTLASGQ